MFMECKVIVPPYTATNLLSWPASMLALLPQMVVFIPTEIVISSALGHTSECSIAKMNVPPWVPIFRFRSAHEFTLGEFEQPVPLYALLFGVDWPAGHSRQDEEPGSGWYLPKGQSAHPPPTEEEYLPARQSSQSANKAVPVAAVYRPPGHFKQEMDAGTGW
jgi:hypothetical protein